jgi:alkaline phosphatase D
MPSKWTVRRGAPPQPTRRTILSYGAATLGLPLFSCATARPYAGTQADPFSLGVASGDPDSTSVVLWTRLAPEPLANDGGMPNASVLVQWDLAHDDRMRTIVATGAVIAAPELGHSVHVEVTGLEPDRWYWYRFRTGTTESPVGRTRTLPAPQAAAARLSFVAASCQSFEQGLFTAYGHMAKEDIDLIVFLGDYIYEYEKGAQGKVRSHYGGECKTLQDYRTRYAQYRTDPLLRRMHERCPWIVTFDDHEVANNYAGGIPAKGERELAAFAARRAAAYQAYWENMPLRASALPRSAAISLYRAFTWGTLAEFFVLDTRQFRTDQPNGDGVSAINSAALDPAATMLGSTQKDWLKAGLKASAAKWNVLAQQVMMGMVDQHARPPAPARYKMDQWPGYAHERMELARFLAEQRVQNPIVLTGDIHSAWCNELRVDDRDMSTPVVATEFVTTSISSGGDGADAPKNAAQLLAANPLVKFHNLQRGYLRCTVTREQWRSDYVVVDRVEKAGGQSSTRASLVVNAGDPRVHPA